MSCICSTPLLGDCGDQWSIAAPLFSGAGFMKKLKSVVWIVDTVYLITCKLFLTSVKTWVYVSLKVLSQTIWQVSICTNLNEQRIVFGCWQLVVWFNPRDIRFKYFHEHPKPGFLCIIPWAEENVLEITQEYKGRRHPCRPGYPNTYPNTAKESHWSQGRCLWGVQNLLKSYRPTHNGIPCLLLLGLYRSQEDCSIRRTCPESSTPCFLPLYPPPLL